MRLIGATTHNPGFYVIPPLLSRSHLFRLEPLVDRGGRRRPCAALADTERGLGALGVTAAAGAFSPISPSSATATCAAPSTRSRSSRSASRRRGGHQAEDLEVFARERRIRYDADEDEHYDTISAFIKSCRGGDPDAAMYWLAKMLVGGEDPRFVARRLVILASEDVGLADPQALPLAVAAHHAVEFVGLPEAELTLAHATLYIATAPEEQLGHARPGRGPPGAAPRSPSSPCRTTCGTGAET